MYTHKEEGKCTDHPWGGHLVVLFYLIMEVLHSAKKERRWVRPSPLEQIRKEAPTSIHLHRYKWQEMMDSRLELSTPERQGDGAMSPHRSSKSFRLRRAVRKAPTSMSPPVGINGERWCVPSLLELSILRRTGRWPLPRSPLVSTEARWVIYRTP